MITIIPSLEIMKAVVDNNISSPSSQLRRIAFDTATNLMSLGDIQILIEGILYDKLKHKLNDDHKTFFTSLYRIDNSAKDVTDYDITKAIKWIANSESNSRRVVIISENIKDYESICNDSIKCFSPPQFLGLVEKAQHYYKVKMFSTLEDSLIAVFFFD